MKMFIITHPHVHSKSDCTKQHILRNVSLFFVNTVSQFCIIKTPSFFKISSFVFNKVNLFLQGLAWQEGDLNNLIFEINLPPFKQTI